MPDLRQTDDVSDYEQAAADVARAIRLGYEAEQGDVNFPFDVPPDEEISWLGAWLASEGFSRPEGWASATPRPH